MATRDELKAAFPSLGPGWDAAIEAGIDVSLLLENLDVSPTARLQLLDSLLSESQALRIAVHREAAPFLRFREVLRQLTEARLEFIVVGGIAATLHGVAEPTRNLDVCIRRANLESASAAFTVDFITDVAPLGGFDQLSQHVELFEVDGVELKVLSRRALIQVKEHVARPKDLEVARALRAIDDAYSSRS